MYLRIKYSVCHYLIILDIVFGIALKFFTESDTWSIDSLSAARSRFGAAIQNDKVIIACGQIFSFFGQWRKEVDILDLKCNTWEPIQPTARRYPAVVGHDDRIYIAGGNGEEDNLDIIEILFLENVFCS